MVHRALIGSALLAVASAGMAQAQSSGAGSSSRASAVRVAAAKKIVTITEVNDKYVFKPKVVTVKVGTRVVWQNKSDAPHTATSTKKGVFNLTKLAAGKSQSFVFTKAGTFKYFCAIHPYMKATVKVTM